MIKNVLNLWLAVGICFIQSIFPQHKPIQKSSMDLPITSGIPLLQNYSPKIYNGGTQNWAVTQDHRGLIYIGNAQGILEYDGVSWRLILLPNNAVVRSLATDADGKVYAGAENEFGYLAPDSAGQLHYTSLVPHLEPEDRKFNEVWKVHPTSEGVYFRTANALFRYEAAADTIKIWRPSTRFHVSFDIDDQFYIRQWDTGLMKMGPDSLTLMPGGEQFANLRIYVMLQRPDGKMLIGTGANGLFLYDGKTAVPFPSEADDIFRQKRLYNGLILPDGRYAFGTLQAGVVILDDAGKIHAQINKAVGLRDETIWNSFLDRQQGLWLALNSGIARVEIASPISKFGEVNGLSGIVAAVHNHQGRIYTATTDGIFRLEPAAHTKNADGSQTFSQASFSKLTGSFAQSWSLLSIEDELLAAANSGVYSIRANGAELIRKSDQPSASLFQSQKDKRRVFIGMGNGLASIYRQNGQWRDEGKIEGIHETVRSIRATSDGALWLGTLSQGALRVRFGTNGDDDKFPGVLQIDRFNKDHGLPSGVVSVLSVSDKILFGNNEGLFAFNEQNGKFKLDSTLTKTLLTNVWTTYQDHQKNLWAAHGGKVSAFLFGDAAKALPPQFTRSGERKGTGNYLHITKPLARLPVSTFYGITADKNGNILAGNAEGIFHFNPAKTTAETVNFSAMIRKVSIHPDSLVFGGAYTTEPITILDYADNAMRIEFAAPAFEDESANRFRYKLDGFDQEWSDWTAETKKDYTNLPEGDYQFRVIAKDIYQQQSKEGIFSFRIHPPWYRTFWAYLMYIIGGLGLIFATASQYIKLRYKRLEARNAVLEKTVLERTEEIRLKSKHIQKQANDLAEKNTELQDKNAEILRTQEQLIAQEKLASLGQLTAGIAHEIKNPLNFVNNFSELCSEMLDELNEGLEKEKGKLSAAVIEEVEEILSTLQDNFNLIQHHGQRADNIVRGMLEHSRGESGKHLKTDINSLLDEYIKLAYHGKRATDTFFDVNINKQFDRNLPAISVIPQDLSRTFLNILNNGFDAVLEKKAKLASDFQPTLTISTADGPEMIEIKIHDNGPGISREIIKQIYNPFFTTKPTGRGNTGLGLSISHEIITRIHHGKLDVHSEPGEFTEFIIQLPKR